MDLTMAERLESKYESQNRFSTSIIFVFIIFIATFGIKNGVCSGEDSNISSVNPNKSKNSLCSIPGIVFDKSISDWFVDRFAGNSTAGHHFYQGPAREVGGLQRVVHTLTIPDGTVYIVSATMGHSSLVTELFKVTRNGVLRLVMENHGLIEGPIGDCIAGRPIWNPVNKTLYLTGPNCLRKVIKKPDGTQWIELVAGIPFKGPGYKEKPKNGPAKSATLSAFPRGVVCNSSGIFYWLESKPYGGRLRQLKNGVISSIKLNRAKNESGYLLNLAMGGAGPWLLSLGENDQTLYISDYYGQNGYVVLKCDITTGSLTRICGVSRNTHKAFVPCMQERNKRFSGETDGPALSHVGGNSGMWGTYDPYYNALWIGCPDASRVRWLKLDGDGWVRTVFCARRPETKVVRYDDNGLGISGEQFRAHQPLVVGRDTSGGVFIINTWNQTGVWRAYNKKTTEK